MRGARPLNNKPIIDARIIEIGARGDGIAETEEGRLYVPGAVPGDLVRARVLERRGDGYSAKIEEILEDGGHRTQPPCPHFGTCGGCALQHIASDTYLEFKRNLVVTALDRHGLSTETVEPCVGFGAATRRRASLKAIGTGRGVVVGFNRAGDHGIVDVDVCPVLEPSIEDFVAPLRDFFKGRLKQGERASVGVSRCGSGLDVLMEVKWKLDGLLRQDLATFAAEADLARLCVGTPANAEEIVVFRPPEIQFASVAVVPPPGAFLQASREAEKFLIDFALEHLGEAGHVADLFSGCGTFALPLACQTQVSAFDFDIQMIDACRAAAGRAGGKTASLRAVRRDLFRNPVSRSEMSEFDGLIFDPPRAGAKAQVSEIAGSSVPRVVAVSCNPATFARDARILVDGGYRLDKLIPLDQFVWSAHVELAAVFEKSV